MPRNGMPLNKASSTDLNTVKTQDLTLRPNSGNHNDIFLSALSQCIKGDLKTSDYWSRQWGDISN